MCEDKAECAKKAQFPFLRRHNPDQVQGSSSTPSQHCTVPPRNEVMMERGKIKVNCAAGWTSI